MNSAIILGNKVEDVITGIVGFVTSIIERHNGMLRYGIQPVSEDKTKVLDAYDIDAVGVVFVADGIMGRVIPSRGIHFELGSVLKDNVSGFEGMAMARNTFINGCVHYCLVPTTLDKDGKLRDSHWLPDDQLKLIKKPATAPVKASKEVPGGPATKSVRM